jgi:hypothetical protein
MGFGMSLVLLAFSLIGIAFAIEVPGFAGYKRPRLLR